MALGQAMDPKYVVEYALASDAILTLESKATSDHYTYRIREFPDRMPPLYWVGILSGPDNTNDYTSLGRISRGIFVWNLNSTVSREAPSFKAFNWMWERLVAEEYHAVSTQCTIYHSGRCSRCNRLLTDPVSVERGLGPVCRKKLGV